MSDTRVETTAGRSAAQGQRASDADYLDFLDTAAERLSGVRNPQALISELFDLAHSAVGVDVYLHYLLGEDGRLHLGSAFGLDATFLEEGATLELGAAVCGQVAEQRRACQVSEVQRSEDPQNDFIRRIGLQSYACTPLVGGDDRLLGTLGFGRRQGPAFSRDEARVLRTLTRYLAIAYERLRTETALTNSERRLRTALQIDTVGAIFFDMDGRLIDANDAFLRMAGYTRADLESGELSWQALTPPEWLSDSEIAFAELKAHGSTTPYEKQYVRKDGTRWWALFAAKLLPDGTGFEFVLETTDRKQAEKRLELLVLELNHRVKNNLATVQSIARQTLKPGEDPAVAREAFLDRLSALAVAHDILTREQWEGVRLRELAHGVLDALVGGDGRLVVEGPEVRLTPAVSLSVSMALHELGTNALKYGALSRPGGHVALTWSADSWTPSIVEICWREMGGPPVSPPRRRGFGSRLLERGLAADLRRPVELRYEPEGLQATMHIPALPLPDR